MQRTHFAIDSLNSDKLPLACECKRSATAVCNCPDGECKCNSLLYDTIFIDVPEYFIQSRNPNKTISILQARFFDLTTGNPIVASMHSDLVQINASADNYCCSTNMLYPVPITLVLPTNKSKFECWFRDYKGKLIDLDPTKVRLILECILEY